MTVVVTRNVEERYRGFLASCMLEIAAGVYTGPRMTTGVRDRVWIALRARSGQSIARGSPAHAGMDCGAQDSAKQTIGNPGSFHRAPSR